MKWSTQQNEIIYVIIPANCPTLAKSAKFANRLREAHILVPQEYLGNVITLAMERRGVQKKITYMSANKFLVTYEMPMNEIVLDFFDRLKSVSRGFASLDYSFNHFQAADLVKLDVLINDERWMH